MSFKITFANVLIGLHYVLLVLCVWTLGWLLALVKLRASGPSDTDMIMVRLMADYPAMMILFGLPLILLIDVLGFVVKGLDYRKHLMHVLALDFVMIAMCVRWIFAE